MEMIRRLAAEPTLLAVFAGWDIQLNNLRAHYYDHFSFKLACVLFAYNCCRSFGRRDPHNSDSDVHICLKQIIIDLSSFSTQIKTACEFHHLEIFIGNDRT
eukprot:1496434-Rhodomonas_salina.1